MFINMVYIKRDAVHLLNNIEHVFSVFHLKFRVFRETVCLTGKRTRSLNAGFNVIWKSNVKSKRGNISPAHLTSS